jgi:tight adherence protein C
MTGLTASATICGLLLGGGLWLLLVRLPFMRPTTFVERIGPQLKSHNLESRLLRTSPRNVTPFGPLERILRPVISDGIASLGKFNLGSSALNRRLVRSGSTKTAVDFRAEQLLWGIGGFVLAVGVVVFAGAAGRFNPLVAVVAVLGSAVGGFLLRDYLLGAQIRKRESRMMAEFPVSRNSWPLPSAPARAPPVRWTGSAAAPGANCRRNLPACLPKHGRESP